MSKTSFLNTDITRIRKKTLIDYSYKLHIFKDYATTYIAVSRQYS